MKIYLEKLIDGKDLTAEEATAAMESVVSGKADPIQTGALLTLLAAKGETCEEITSLVTVMVKYCLTVKIEGPLLDIVGTGGDGASTVNLSTGAAILAAACGARVAKHGNRSVSSRSGSADVLEAMNIPFLHPHLIAPCVAQAQIAFMYSPTFHPAMKHVVPIRRALGVRTVFNILGPLLNPARCGRMMVGVYTPTLLPIYGKVFQALGVEHALIIHCAGLDELNPMGVADCVEVHSDGTITSFTLDCAAVCGIPSCQLSELQGGDAETNATLLRSVLSGGEAADNAIGNTLALNAGAGLYVYGMVSSIQDGYQLAKRVLQEGKGLAMLETWSQVALKLKREGLGEASTPQV